MLTAPTQQYHRPSNTTLIAWCAAASLGMLFLKLNQFANLSVGYRALPPGVPDFLPLAVAVGALVAWHLAPRRAWAWLLLAGGACAVPGALLGVAPGLYDPSMYDALLVLKDSAPVLTMVGVLGAATRVWQAGSRTIGAALTGTAVVVQLVGPVVILATRLDEAVAPVTAGLVLSVATVLFAVVAIVGAAVAIVVARSGEVVRPRWRVTIAGGAAVASQILLLMWRPGPPRTPGPPSDYFLHIGLVMLAVGLVIAASAGRVVLLGAVGAGVLLGAFSMLISPSVEVLREIPAVGVVAAVGATLLGFWAAMSRLRREFGLGGLLVVFLGLLVLFGLFTSDLEYDSYETFTFVATPVLLVAGVVAAVCAMSATGDALSERSATPAVLVGAVTPLSLGTIAVIAHFMVHAPEARAPLAGLLPPTAGALLLAALALAALPLKRAGGTGEVGPHPTSGPAPAER